MVDEGTVMVESDGGWDWDGGWGKEDTWCMVVMVVVSVVDVGWDCDGHEDCSSLSSPHNDCSEMSAIIRAISLSNWIRDWQTMGIPVSWTILHTFQRVLNSFCFSHTAKWLESLSSTFSIYFKRTVISQNYKRQLWFMTLHALSPTEGSTMIPTTISNAENTCSLCNSAIAKIKYNKIHISFKNDSHHTQFFVASLKIAPSSLLPIRCLVTCPNIVLWLM